VTLDRHGCYEFLLSRRSIRRFRDMPVAEQTLRRILTAACRAPSAHNRQPWRFVVIEGGEQREHLAREMSAEMPVHADDRQQWAERIMAVQSVALAGGQLLLAAHAEGLGAFWVGAALFAPQAIQQSLDLPSAWEPQGMILMGEPSDQGEDRGRKPLEEVVLWR